MPRESEAGEQSGEAFDVCEDAYNSGAAALTALDVDDLDAASALMDECTDETEQATALVEDLAL